MVLYARQNIPELKGVLVDIRNDPWRVRMIILNLRVTFLTGGKTQEENQIDKLGKEAER